MAGLAKKIQGTLSIMEAEAKVKTCDVTLLLCLIESDAHVTI